MIKNYLIQKKNGLKNNQMGILMDIQNGVLQLTIVNQFRLQQKN